MHPHVCSIMQATAFHIMLNKLIALLCSTMDRFAVRMVWNFTLIFIHYSRMFCSSHWLSYAYVGILKYLIPQRLPGNVSIPSFPLHLRLIYLFLLYFRHTYRPTNSVVQLKGFKSFHNAIASWMNINSISRLFFSIKSASSFSLAQTFFVLFSLFSGLKKIEKINTLIPRKF